MAKIVSKLRETGFDGALTVEFVAPINRTPANPFPDAIETEPVDIREEQHKFNDDHCNHQKPAPLLARSLA